jgi:tRNA/rRNA methyltransferase
MPGAGTDSSKDWAAVPAPIVVLVETQLGENIGAAARAMANFGLARLRLVKPRCAWPSREAAILASGADRILEQAQVFETLHDAIADCHFVLAATARAHDQAKPVIGADTAAREAAPRVAGGETVAFVFGRERNGLENDEIGLADRIVTLPVNPAFASLNLSQAVVILGYEWFKLASAGALPFGMPQKSPPAPKEQVLAFFQDLEKELERIEYFRPEEKRDTMITNMRNIFHRMEPTQQDIRTLHGIIMAIAQGRKGPARGGVLNAKESEMLRSALAESVAPDRAPPRGLSRLLRRNPTDAERALWHAVTHDARFTLAGFKRQTPVGPHIVDLVSFTHRAVIEIEPGEESGEAGALRAQRREWLVARGYTTFSFTAKEIEQNAGAVLDRLADALALATRGAAAAKTSS